MKITVDNKDYELDVQRSLSLGVLTEIYTSILNPVAGDLVAHDYGRGEPVIIIRDISDKYCFIGLDRKFLTYRNSPMTFDELCNHLKVHSYVRLRNVNQQLADMMKK